MTSTPESDEETLTVTVDGDRVPEAAQTVPEQDWAWRARIRASPTMYPAYRALVFGVGLVIVVVGLLLVPLPGPGWLIVIAGLLVWASEFERAHRLTQWVRAKVHVWDHWVRRQHWSVQLFFAVLTALCVAGALWLTMFLAGVPTFLPDPLEGWLHHHARL